MPKFPMTCLRAFSLLSPLAWLPVMEVSQSMPGLTEYLVAYLPAGGR